MDKKRTSAGIIGIVLVCGFVFLGCSTTPTQSTQLSKELTDRAGEGESEILIERRGSMLNVLSAGTSMNIFIDGELKFKLDKGTRTRIVVPNGHHIIQAGFPTHDTEEITVDLNSTLATFTAKVTGIGWGIELTKVSEVALDNPSVRGGLGKALTNAAQVLLSSLPQGAKIAIVNVSSGDKEQAAFVAGELEYMLLNRGLVIIDRSELDQLRQEQNFQLSGDVDEASAVSIGKIAGAAIIITGSVSGDDETRRLRLRAVNTQNGQVMAAASEPF